MVCASNKSKQAINSNGVVNDNYILDNSVRQTPMVREAKFDFFDEVTQTDWSRYISSPFLLGKFSIFQTAKIDNSPHIAWPMFCVNNENESIIVTDYVEESNHNQNTFVPDWDHHTFVRAEYEYKNVKEIKVNTVKMMDLQEIHLYFLMTINESFHDDMLMDCISLLK